MLIPFLAVVCLAAVPSRGQVLRYRELEEMGAACAPRDTCVGNDPVDFSERNCECDSMCGAYEDCCIDSRHLMSHVRHKHESCVPVPTLPGVYMKTTCKSRWIGQAYIKAKCRYEPRDASDPLALVPVTNQKKALTYKNYYCAICNDNGAEGEFWLIRLSCPSLNSYNKTFGNLTQEYVVRFLVFERAWNLWGIWLWNVYGELKFFKCDVDYVPSDEVLGAVRKCRPQLISRCASTWKDPLVWQKCAAYLAAVYWQNQKYRNPHCALCNNVPLSNISCQSVPQRVRIFHATSFSFATLLDVNENAGGSVGVMNTCKYGEVYDPFFKRCRNTVCGIPGYRYRDGKCVRQR